MKKIDALIIGAQKAGTTSLKNYLSQHDEIITHEVIEFPFFKDIEVYNQGYFKSFDKYFKKQKDANFYLAKSAAIYYDIEALKRVKEHNPECKLILSLREPVSRTISAYNMELFYGGFNSTMKDIINAIKSKEFDNILFRVFIEQSLYSKHIGRIFEVFPKNQIKIIDYHNLIKDPQKECNLIWNWFGLNTNVSLNSNIIHNQTKPPRSKILSNILKKLRRNDSIIKKMVKAVLPYRIFTKLGMFLLDLNKSENKKINQVDSKDIEYLKNFYRPYNEKLRKLSGINFNL